MAKNSLLFVPGTRVPFQNCPICSEPVVRLNHLPHLTCRNNHLFYACPTCLDTRVNEVKENVIYCGNLHPYHLCGMHQTANAGVASYNTDRCTCPHKPIKTSKKDDASWASAFI